MFLLALPFRLSTQGGYQLGSKPKTNISVQLTRHSFNFSSTLRMDQLPPEVVIYIASYCDFHTLLSLRCVNRKWTSVTSYVLNKWNSLDFSLDVITALQNEPDFSGYNSEKFVRLFRLMPNVKELKINSTMARLSCSDFILIAKVLSKLETLVIIQTDRPQIAYDALYSLSFFSNLKHLSIEGWKQLYCHGRGSSHRTTLPYPYFVYLHSLKLQNSPTIMTFLLFSNESRNKMTKLKSIEIVFTEQLDGIIEQLVLFFASHPSLSFIALENLPNSDPVELNQLLRVFFQLEAIQTIELKNLDSEMTSTMETFKATMKRKNLRFQLYY